MKNLTNTLVILMVGLLGTPLWAQTNSPSGDWKSVVVSVREPKTGICSLRAKGYLLSQPRAFKFKSLWKYSPQNEKWTEVLPRLSSNTEIKPVRPAVVSGKDHQLLINLTDEIGLFWAWFEEDGKQTGVLVYSGPVLPDDLKIGPDKPGFIRTGIPYKDHAAAAYVPDPKKHCK